MNMNMHPFRVAIVGAGPAGLYAAQELVKRGDRVVLFNRDVKPGGLAEYGIYPDKYKMKQGLRAQFNKILDLPDVAYIGNVTVGRRGDLTLDELFELGFDAILVTAGAQGIKSLGLPGENLEGVYHAKDVVYHYNRLPPYSTGEFVIGKRVVIVGVGNVMMDLAHWLVRDLRVDTVIAVARRGPAQVKFDKKEFETVGANVDLAALDAEIARSAPFMQAVGQDPAAARAEILAGLPRALPPVSATRLLFRFLSSPRELCGHERGHVAAVELEDNRLVRAGDQIKAHGLGTVHEVACDTFLFAIGDQVDPGLGLPTARGEFVHSPEPRFPVDGVSYEAYDPETHQPIPGVFLAGWSRQASTGLVGVARKDGTNGAHALATYLATLPHSRAADLDALRDRLTARGVQFVTRQDLFRLAQAEASEARLRGLEEYKFPTNAEMLQAMCKT